MHEQKLVVLGGGESGVGAALLAQAKGFTVFLSDKSLIQDRYKTILSAAEIEFEEGQHTEQLILAAHEVVKSPGIPDTAPIVQALQRQGTPVISEIELAARYTKAKLIGITGSNGKTTTTLLIYHLLKVAGINVGLAGNIGDSFARQVIDDTFDYYVLELSSFQLDGMYDTRLDTAVLLNITPDHLDRYGYNFQNYVDSKFRIVQNMRPDDTFIYFRESPAVMTGLSRKILPVKQLPISLVDSISPGGYVQAGDLVARTNHELFRLSTASLPLEGPHNLINMLAAILTAQTQGVANETIADGLRTFQNAPHRMEPVGEIDGIRFINDSKATNVDSVFYALSSMKSPIVWIAGGVDKGNDYSQLDDIVSQTVKALVCLGKDNSKLREHFVGKIPVIVETDNLDEAIAQSKLLADAGDVVLLSPACASFDLFRNYEDRGNQFKAAVKALTTA